MEKRYRDGEILSVFDYEALLFKHASGKARIKVMRNQKLFELAIDKQKKFSKHYLQQRYLPDILKSFVLSGQSKGTIVEIRKRIESSGHTNLVNKFFEYFLSDKSMKKNKLFIKGKSTTGKT